MVAADGHPRAPGGGAGETHRGGGDVGAVLRELHHVGGRDGPGSVPRPRPPRWTAGRSCCRGRVPPHRLDDRWVGVTETDRPQPGAVLDVAVAVDVPHVGTAAVADDRGQVRGTGRRPWRRCARRRGSGRAAWTEVRWIDRTIALTDRAASVYSVEIVTKRADDLGRPHDSPHNYLSDLATCQLFATNVS